MFKKIMAMSLAAAMMFYVVRVSHNLSQQTQATM